VRAIDILLLDGRRSRHSLIEPACRRNSSWPQGREIALYALVDEGLRPLAEGERPCPAGADAAIDFPLAPSYSQRV
jgi:hypothetical protein